MQLGVDIVPVARIAAAIEKHGDRFLKRIYTPGELAYARGSAEKLAGRWAAKEAVLKALGGRGRFPRMSLVEVLPNRRGAPTVTLTREPTPEIAVSITHDGGLGVAIAAAVAGTTRKPQPRIPAKPRLP
ncbi:MAG: holo-ACP synthase, partial [Candidatus Dormibacteria bacterium]